MHDEASFLEAIRDNPRSRAERLVYADWLTDHDDPRGEFTHLQCRAIGLSLHAPRRLALEAQCADLLFRHEAQWLGPLVGHVGNWEWRGGLLDWVTVDADVFLAHAARWLPALPLLGLHLRRAHRHVAALARCPQLAHVTGLFLGDDALADNHLKTLLRSKHLGRVRALHLHQTQLTDEAAELLARTEALPRLRELNLSMCDLTGAGVLALGRATGLRRLRHLTLMLTRFGDTPLDELFASPLFGRLRVVNLSSCNLGPGPLASLGRSPALANLHGLGYSMNQPGDAGVVALAESPHAAGLRTLAVGGYLAFGDPALRALAASPHLGGLRYLDLGCGTWTPAGVRALCRSRSLRAIRTLHLTPSGEHAGGVAGAVFGDPMIRRLRELRFESSKIGPAALAALGSHPRPLSLRRLVLPLGQAAGEAWQALLAKGALNGLTDLELRGVPAGGLRGLVVPGRFPELRRLRLYGIPTDLDEFQALLDAPLWRRLTSFHLDADADKPAFGDELVRRLTAAWDAPGLTTLGLLWTLTDQQVRLLTAAPPPPRLQALELGSLRLTVAGINALAGWPALRHLRRLHFRNSSVHNVPGLTALARSPHAGELLRIDVGNGGIPREDVPELRQRFGMRVAVGGRIWPKTVVVGGWGALTGDGLD